MQDRNHQIAQHIAATIADEIGAQTAQAKAAIALLDEGATVPFIARYRKEVTGGLDDTQLRNLEVRLTYLRELEDRRAAVLASIDEQGKLTDELRAEIEAADTKSRLEDLYLPYKPKKQSLATRARDVSANKQLWCVRERNETTQRGEGWAANPAASQGGISATGASVNHEPGRVGRRSRPERHVRI